MSEERKSASCLRCACDGMHPSECDLTPSRTCGQDIQSSCDSQYLGPGPGNVSASSGVESVLGLQSFPGCKHFFHLPSCNIHGIERVGPGKEARVDSKFALACPVGLIVFWQYLPSYPHHSILSRKRDKHPGSCAISEQACILLRQRLEGTPLTTAAETHRLGHRKNFRSKGNLAASQTWYDTSTPQLLSNDACFEPRHHNWRHICGDHPLRP